MRERSDRTAAGHRNRRAAVFSRTRLADRERTAIEDLSIEPLNGGFGMRADEELHECKPARATCLPIDGKYDLRRRRHRAEIGTKVCLRRAVRQVTNEQPDSQSVISLLW